MKPEDDVLNDLRRELFNTYNAYITANYCEPHIRVTFSPKGHCLARASINAMEVFHTSDLGILAIDGCPFTIELNQEEYFIVHVGG